MIVDDSKMIIGSANVNDRSMIGSRDSELGVYIEGNGDLLVSDWRGRKYAINSKIHEFRKGIFKEHFGMTDSQVQLPNHPRFWADAWNVVKINTQFYDHAFKMYPSNLYANWKELSKRPSPHFNRQAFDQLHQIVQGHAVEYPYSFLISEALEDAKKQDFALFIIPIKILY